MRICPALLCCLVSLLFAARFCQGDDDNVEVLGIGECADCERNHIDAKQAFSGTSIGPVTISILHVTHPMAVILALRQSV